MSYVRVGLGAVPALQQAAVAAPKTTTVSQAQVVVAQSAAAGVSVPVGTDLKSTGTKNAWTAEFERLRKAAITAQLAFTKAGDKLKLLQSTYPVDNKAVSSAILAMGMASSQAASAMGVLGMWFKANPPAKFAPLDYAIGPLPLPNGATFAVLSTAQQRAAADAQAKAAAAAQQVAKEKAAKEAARVKAEGEAAWAKAQAQVAAAAAAAGAGPISLPPGVVSTQPVPDVVIVDTDHGSVPVAVKSSGMGKVGVVAAVAGVGLYFMFGRS